MSERRRGRPLVDEPLRQIGIRISDSLRDRLKHIADRDGTEPATWARAAIERAVAVAEKQETPDMAKTRNSSLGKQ